MINFFKNKVNSAIVLTVLALTAGSANATVDVSGTVTEVGLAVVAVAAIGAAVILVKVGVKLYKWASAAL